MATGRIESGRVDIRAPGSVPMQRVSVQGVEQIGARVEAQGASQLAEALDRMSGALFQDALVSRQREGLQFAAENPPTPEQIEAAKNGDLSSLNLGGNPVSVFQQAVRKARALQLSQQFEMEGSAELVKALKLVELGQADASQILTQINTMTEGLGRTLSKIDPEAAYKFRASMATSGNAVYRDALNAQVKRAQEQALIKADEHFRNRREILQAAAINDPDNFDLQASVFVSDMNRIASSLSSPAFQAQYSQQARDAVKAAKVGAVSTFVTSTDFSADPFNALKRLDANDAGKMTKLWAGMNFEERAQVRNNLRTIVTDRQSAADRVAKETLDADAVKVAQLESDFFRTGNRKLLEELRAISIRNPKAITPERVFELPKKLSEGEIANPRAEYLLKTEIMQGLYPDPASLEKRAKELGIGYQRLNQEVLSFFNTRTDRQRAEVDRLFATEAKIIPGQVNIEQRRADALSSMQRRFRTAYEEAVAKAKAKNELPPTLMQVAEQVVKGRRTSSASVAIEQALQRLNEKYGNNPNAIRRTAIVFDEDTNVNDIASRAKQLGLKPEDVDAIRQDYRAIEIQRKKLDAE